MPATRPASSPADIRRRADAMLADAARQAAELYAAAAGTDADAMLPTVARRLAELYPSPLNPTALAAAAFIDRNPGRSGPEVAAAAGVEPVTFYRYVSPALRSHGYTSSPTHGYRPPGDGRRVTAAV